MRARHASLPRWIQPPGATTATARLGVARGVRAAVVTFAGFALGLWCFHDIGIAVFSGFAGIAITGIADYQGRRGFRALAVSASAALGAALVALGTEMSNRPVWSQMVVVFVVVAAVAFTRVMGGYALAGADAVTLFYLVASGSPAPTSALPSRLAGVALGGGLAVVVACLQGDRLAGRELGRVLAQLIAGAADRLSLLSGGELPPPEAGAADPPAATGIRQLFDGRSDRPMGPVPSQRAALYLVNDLERLDGLLARLEGSDQLPVPGQRHVFGELSGCLAESARTLAGRGDPGGPAGPPSPPSVDGFGLVARLSVVAGAITVHAGSYARSYGLSGHGGRGWLAGDGLGEFTVHAGRRFRANLTVHSVRLQDAVRLGLGLMVAVLTIHLLGLQHGFWVALATLSVVKSDARRTGQSLGEAVVGTAIGFGIAGPVIAAVGSRPGWLTALLPLTLFAAFYAKSALSFLVGQAAFTMAVLVMFNLLAPFGWSLGVVRLEDVVAGALVGLAVGVLAWPRGADASIGWTGSRLVDTSARYLVAAVHARPAPAPGPGPGDPAVRLRQPALDASILADDVFAELLGEGAERSGVGRWGEVLSFGNRMRYAGDLVTTQQTHAMAAAGPSAAARAAATHLGDTCHQLSVDLRAPGRSTGADRPVEPRPDPDPDTDDDLTRWMQDLTARACALLGPGPTERRSR